MLLLPGEKLEGFGKVLSSGTFQSLVMYRRPLPSGNRTIDVPAILCCFLLRRALSHVGQ